MQSNKLVTIVYEKNFLLTKFFSEKEENGSKQKY
jgi:hypothetical protein